MLYKIMKTYFALLPAAWLFLTSCSPQSAPPDPVEIITVSIADQVASVLDDEKGTVIGLYVKPERSTSCEQMYVELSVFDNQALTWSPVIDFEIKRNSDSAVGGPDIEDQLYLARITRRDEMAISAIGCKPYQKEMSLNYQTFATFKPEYGKINIIGVIEQYTIADGVNIYDFTPRDTEARILLSNDNPALEDYVVPVDLGVTLWEQFLGYQLTPADIVANKHGAKDYILYQIALRERTNLLIEQSELMLDSLKHGIVSAEEMSGLRRVAIKFQDESEEDIYRFYDMLDGSTTIENAMLYTAVLSEIRIIDMKRALLKPISRTERRKVIDLENLKEDLEASGQLKSANLNSRMAAEKNRQALRLAIFEAEVPYLEEMFPYRKFHKESDREKRISIGQNYADALKALDQFDANRHITRTGMAGDIAALYLDLYVAKSDARTAFLLDFAERVTEDGYMASSQRQSLLVAQDKASQNIEDFKLILVSNFQ
ncbi:hypothetical protein [Fretibacter rubidus]|uniref:hypothetical protein n=1 Tax=Fretibacter rubidus TaxID=570162 RepID=UPI00352B18E9